MRQGRAGGPAQDRRLRARAIEPKGEGKVLTPEVKRARLGVFILFALTGVVTGSYLSRLPTIREDLDLTFAQAGSMLLCQSIAAMALVPVAGSIVQRIGSRKAVTISAISFTVAFALIGIAPGIGSVPLFGFALACMGAGFGLGNVPQNIESAAVERGVGRAIISQFHAAYSLGCVGGAGIGALTSALSVPLFYQFMVTAVVTLVIRLYAVRLFLPDSDPLVGLVQAREAQRVNKIERSNEKAKFEIERTEHKKQTKAIQQEQRNRNKAANSGYPLQKRVRVAMSPHRVRAAILPPRTNRPVRRTARSSMSAWAEPRTVLIGVVLIAAAMSEGSANDWLPIGVVTGFGQTEAIGAICFAVFLAAMTGVRLLGGRLIDSMGRVRVLRYSACLSFIGLLTFALSPSLAFGAVGIVAWGLGAALIFPICVSAASDDPVRAAGRVSVISSFSSAAGLAVPPMFGFVAEHIGVQRSLGLIAIPLLATILLAKVVAPAEPRTVVEQSAPQPEPEYFGDADAAVELTAEHAHERNDSDIRDYGDNEAKLSQQAEQSTQAKQEQMV